MCHLTFPDAAPERKVNQKKRRVFKLELDDKPLKAVFEIVELLLYDLLACEESVALRGENGESFCDSVISVLHAKSVVRMSYCLRHVARLMLTTHAERAPIRFNQTNNIGLQIVNELSYGFKVGVCMAQYVHPGATGAPASSVANVVKDKAHYKYESSVVVKRSADNGLTAKK